MLKKMLACILSAMMAAYLFPFAAFADPIDESAPEEPTQDAIAAADEGEFEPADFATETESPTEELAVEPEELAEEPEPAVAGEDDVAIPDQAADEPIADEDAVEDPTGEQTAEVAGDLPETDPREDAASQEETDITALYLTFDAPAVGAIAPSEVSMRTEPADAAAQEALALRWDVLEYDEDGNYSVLEEPLAEGASFAEGFGYGTAFDAGSLQLNDGYVFADNTEVYVNGELAGIGLLPWCSFGPLTTEEAVESEEALEPQTEPESAYTLSYSYNHDQMSATVEGITADSVDTGVLIIPETVEFENETYTVTSIASNAFKNKTGFTGLQLPSTITVINASAFEGCSGFAGSLNLPANLQTVGDAAFKNCSGFTGSLVLPAGLTSLGVSAFQDCKYLTGTLTIPASVASIADYCFYSSDLQYGSHPGYTNIAFAQGSQLESIGAYAFAYCSEALTGGLDFPATLTSIGDYAFYNTGNKVASAQTGWQGVHPYGDGYEGYLTLPAGIQYIGSYAFSLCNFNGDLVIPNATVIMGDSAFHQAGFYDGDLVLPEGTTTISNDCFSENSFTARLTLPSTITTIGNSAFCNCKDFDTTLVIPEGAESIGNNAFACFAQNSSYYNGSLTLPSTLKTIGSGAFSDADSFTGALVIPDSVESIGTYAFEGCRYFTSLTLPNNPNFTAIPDYAFASSSSYTNMYLAGELVIPESVTSIGRYAFRYCSFTGDLNIPNGVTTISNNAFDHCRCLTGTLTLPSSLTTIGGEAFTWCDSLTGISIPNGVTSIGDKAFFGCESCGGNLVIPGSVQKIGIQAFGQFGNKATQQGTLTIQSGVQEIGYAAFSNSGGHFVGTVVVPDTVSVSKMGESVFSSCTGLTGYQLPDSWTTVPSSTFSSCPGLTGSLVLPASATTIGNSAFRGCSGLTGEIALPEGMTSIGSYVFEDCSGLSGELVIPDSVTRIGSCAFANCSGLSGSLTIPESVTAIDAEAFKGCSGFTGSLVLPQGLTSLGSGAFEGCSGLSGDVTLPASLTNLRYGSDIFYGCTGLTGTLTIPETLTSAYKDYTLRGTYFSTIVNNSGCTFDAATMVSSPSCDYYVDAADPTATQVQSIGTGTYTRVAREGIDLATAAVIDDIPDQIYTGSYVKPTPVVRVNGVELTAGTDYTVSYSNYWSVGTGTVTVTGVGFAGYCGKASKDYQIVSPPSSDPVDISDATVTLVNASSTYTGKAQQGAVKSVVLDGETLAEGTDYTVSATSGTNVGSYTVTISGVASAGYTGSATAAFKITAASLSSASVSVSPKRFYYTGKAITPSPTVKVGGTTLRKGSDYTVSYKNNANVGTATATVTGKGNYAGTKSATYTIYWNTIAKKVVGEGTVELRPGFDANGNQIAGSMHAAPGTTVVFRTIPKAGYFTSAFKVKYTDPATGTQKTLTSGNGLTRTAGTGGAGTTAEYSFTMPDCDVSINAEFKVNDKKYPITKNMTGTGKAGSNLMLVGSDGKVAGQTKDKVAPTMNPKAGQTVYFKSVPSSNAKLTKFNVTYSYTALDGSRQTVKLITGKGITSHGGGLYSFTMPCYPVTLTGEFTKK